MVKHKGLTLLELLIGIAIVSILITVVAPNANNIIVQSRAISDLNNFSALARFARFTAVNEQQTVTLCPTSNYSSCSEDWLNAKMIFIDTDNDGDRDDDENLIHTADPVSENNTFSGISDTLTFNANGGISENATVTICSENGADSDAVGLSLTTYGHISIAIDENNDGVKQDLSGNSLSCSSGDDS